MLLPDQDISTAVSAFKQQYHMYPGDMLITTEVPNVRAACIKGGANAGDSDGQINNSLPNPESACVAEVLYQAGLAKVGQVNNIPTFTTYYGSAIVMATSFSSVVTARGSSAFLPSIIHIVELQNITCDVALTIDRKIDDGDLSKGKVQSPNTTCVSGSNIITTLDVAL